VEDLHRLQDKYEGVTTSSNIKFLAVYIVEAHAIDEWPVGDPLKITQPRTISERCGVARAFIDEYNLKMPMVVDQIDNNFSEQYAGWPVRFYVVQRNEDEQDWKLVFKGQPDHVNTYDSVPKQLDLFLSGLTAQQC